MRLSIRDSIFVLLSYLYQQITRQGSQTVWGRVPSAGSEMECEAQKLHWGVTTMNSQRWGTSQTTNDAGLTKSLPPIGPPGEAHVGGNGQFSHRAPVLYPDAGRRTPGMGYSLLNTRGTPEALRSKWRNLEGLASWVRGWQGKQGPAGSLLVLL